MSKKVLLVDDNDFVRRVTTRKLTAQGYLVCEARDGYEACAVFTSERPDLVLLDITMPQLDGLTTLREILAIDADAKVVMLTALGKQAQVDEATRLGALDFLIKPVPDDRLLRTVAHYTDDDD